MSSNTTHPKALKYIFLTEMWERFSYYGITAILILYISHTFGVTDAKTYAIYGAYGALVYTTPIIGGYIADRFWSSYHAIIVGAWLIALGHFVLMIVDPHRFSFYAGLAMIIVGTGFFIPNIATVVGQLYDKHDPRKDRGFTIAYVGRNIGAILAPVIAAYVAKIYGWNIAFGLAGFGMLAGIYTFSRGRKYYNKRTFLPNNGKSINTRNTHFFLLLGVIALTAFIYYAMRNVSWVGPILAVTVVGTLLYILARAGKQKTVYIALLLTGFYVVFKILLQQSGGALNLMTDRSVDRVFMGFTIPTGAFQSVEPLFVLLLAPLYQKLWSVLQQRNIIIHDGVKFLLSLLIMGSSFLVLGLAMFTANKTGLIAMSWMNFTYFIQAASELFIGPIGLAMVTRLVPDKIQGVFMGFWVLATAIANYFAAEMGKYVTPPDGSTAAFAVAHYQHVFYMIAAGTGVMALLLIVCLPYIRSVYKSHELADCCRMGSCA